MSPQPYTNSIAGPTDLAGDGFVPITLTATRLRLATLQAIDGDITWRRAGDQSAEGVMTIAEGASHDFVGVDLAEIEVNVPNGASVQIFGSPF